MNFDEFSKLASAGHTHNPADEPAHKMIENIYHHLDEFVEPTHKKYPDTLQTLNVGSNAFNTTAMISLNGSYLMYTYESGTISAKIDNTPLADFAYNGTDFVDASGRILTNDVVDELLDAFKN